ncbi:hypothetical protein B0H14DRAFT_2761492 [Mycena olivaceomarginata]|nr:hypothetical protein B0H14DRAFT_2761492 [Mycena olivaceomarginata]
MGPGSDVVKTRLDYQRMLLAIHQTSITSEQLGDNDRVNGCKLLLNLRSSINALHHPCLSDRLSSQLLQPIIVTALSQLDKPETAALRLANLEVLISVVLY